MVHVHIAYVIIFITSRTYWLDLLILKYEFRLFSC